MAQKAAQSSATSNPANGRISQAPSAANTVAIPSDSAASAANTSASPCGEIEQWRFTCTRNPAAVAAKNAAKH